LRALLDRAVLETVEHPPLACLVLAESDIVLGRHPCPDDRPVARDVGHIEPQLFRGYRLARQIDVVQHHLGAEFLAVQGVHEVLYLRGIVAVPRVNLITPDLLVDPQPL
jgi:hypothetical protein